MRDDAAFLIGSDRQRRETSGAPPFLQRRDLGSQRVHAPTRPRYIVLGDVDACDQAPICQARDLIEG